MLGQRRFGKIQTALLVVIALVIGASLISPAVGHVKKSIKHLYKHLDPRYVNVGEKATSAGTADTAANADKLDNIDSSGFLQTSADTVGRSGFDAGCDPTSATFINCASLTITLTRTSRLLVTHQAPFGVDSVAPAFGQCRVLLDGTTIPNTTVSLGLDVNSSSADSANTGGGATVVTAPVSAGAHTLVQQCNAIDEDIDFNDLSLSAVAIGSA